jgi:hypothetical protein
MAHLLYHLLYISLLVNHPPAIVTNKVNGYTVPDSMMIQPDERLMKELGFEKKNGSIIYKASFEKRDHQYQLFVDCNSQFRWCKVDGKVYRWLTHDAKKIKAKKFKPTLYVPEFISDETISIGSIIDFDFDNENKNAKKEKCIDRCKYFVPIAFPLINQEGAKDSTTIQIGKWTIFWYRKENLPAYIQSTVKTAR